MFAFRSRCMAMVGILLLCCKNLTCSSIPFLSFSYVTISDIAKEINKYISFSTPFLRPPYENENVLETIHLPSAHIKQTERCSVYPDTVYYSNCNPKTPRGNHHAPHRSSWLYWCMLFLLCLFRPTAADPFVTWLQQLPICKYITTIGHARLLGLQLLILVEQRLGGD